MSGEYSTQQLALETLLEAAPFSFRPIVLPSGDAPPGMAETSVGDDVRGYTYDLVMAGEDFWEPLSDHEFNVGKGLLVVVFIPRDNAQTANAQQRDCSDLGERVRSGVLTSRSIDAKATGPYVVRWIAARDQWVVSVPIMLRYEENARS